MINLLKLNNRKIKILLAGLLLVILGIFFWTGRVDAKIINKDVTIKRVVFGNEKTENGYLSLSFSKNDQKYQYVNIAIDFNKDGIIADYQVQNKTQKEWVVQNIDTKVFVSEGGNYDIKLSDFALDDQQDFPAQIILTKKSLSNWQGKKLRGSGYQSAKISSIELDDISSRFTPSTQISGKTGFWDNSPTPVFAQDQVSANTPPVSDDLQKELEDLTKSEIQKRLNPLNPNPTPTQSEPTVATLGKEFDVFNNDIPDIDQGKNECAPTSVANSLQWLAKKNSFTDKMPNGQGDLINELKGDLKWGVDKGVNDEDFITGKKAFASRHNISIEVHRVAANDYDLNIVAKIAQELQKGQDVEIGLEFWKKQADGKWKIVGGHWVTAVGARGTRDGQRIYIHDPASPGPSSLDSYKVDGTRIIDYRYQGDTIAYIQYAVAESPITPPTTTTADSSTPSTTTPTSTATTGATSTTTTPTNSGASASTTNNNSDSSSTNTTNNQTSPSTPVALPEEPVFSGEYETGTTEDTGYLNLMAMPTNMAGQNFYGMQVDLGAQSPTLASPNSVMSNVNLEGWNTTDWACEINGTIVRCHGNKPMIINKKSIVTLYYPLPFNLGLPNPIIVYILDANGNARYRVVVNQQQ